MKFRLMLAALSGLLLLTGFPVSAAAPGGGGNGPGLGYSCSKTAGTIEGTCSCSGYFDCKDMTDAKVCKGDIASCSHVPGKAETCTCTWKVRLKPADQILPAPNNGKLSP